ncbi:MAG: hypothetical protein BRD48_01180 [Bacteroidetes bacterium QS_9_68_14]|nr:MAG: hypothetical protein BRD48_01180 [Bacteroidetes bacterium QS_9_68_14]
MSNAPPDRDGTTTRGEEEATFYLDAQAETHERFGFHEPGRSPLPRFLMAGCALLLALGLGLGVALDGWSFLGRHYWTLLLWAGIAFLVYRFTFRQRPYFHIGAEGLAARTRAYRAEQRVAWGELARVELEPEGLVLHRDPGGPVHLPFSTLSEEREAALRDALAAAAQDRGVEVARTGGSH